MGRGDDGTDEGDEYDGAATGDDVYRQRFDVSKPGAMSLAVIEAVTTVLDEPDTARRSLYEVIDPDAMDRLFRPRRNGRPRVNGTVSFPVAEYEVRVDSEGVIVVSRRDGVAAAGTDDDEGDDDGTDDGDENGIVDG